MSTLNNEIINNIQMTIHDIKNTCRIKYEQNNVDNDYINKISIENKLQLISLCKTYYKLLFSNVSIHKLISSNLNNSLEKIIIILTQSVFINKMEALEINPMDCILYIVDNYDYVSPLLNDFNFVNRLIKNVNQNFLDMKNCNLKLIYIFLILLFKIGYQYNLDFQKFMFTDMLECSVPLLDYSSIKIIIFNFTQWYFNIKYIKEKDTVIIIKEVLSFFNELDMSNEKKILTSYYIYYNVGRIEYINSTHHKKITNSLKNAVMYHLLCYKFKSQLKNINFIIDFNELYLNIVEILRCCYKFYKNNKHKLIIAKCITLFSIFQEKLHNKNFNLCEHYDSLYDEIFYILSYDNISNESEIIEEELINILKFIFDGNTIIDEFVWKTSSSDFFKSVNDLIML